MATETLILRPTGVGGTGTPAYYPEDTGDYEYYKCVSEEIADDDASYVVCNSVIFGYMFTIPDEYINMTPSSVKIHFRVRAEVENSADVLILDGYIASTDSTNGYSDRTIGEIKNLSTTYQNYCEEISQEYITPFYTALCDKDHFIPESESAFNNEYHIGLLLTSSDKNSCYLTQLYIELIYGESETETSETIFIKENGSWVALSGDVYKKEDGTWVLSDSSVLQNGNRYVVNNV